MRNLDVGIILIYCNIYSLWSWTFKNSQRLTFSAFVWKLAKIYSFMIRTSLDAFARQTCKAGLDWCCQHVNMLANDQSKKKKIHKNFHSSRKAGYCFYGLNFFSIKFELNRELIKPCEVEVEVRQIKHVQKHIWLCLALSSMAKLWINAFEVRVRAFFRKSLPFVYNITP